MKKPMKRLAALSLLSLGALGSLHAQPTLRGPLTTNSPVVKAAYDGGLIDAATNNFFRVPVSVNTNLIITNISIGQAIRVEIWCTNGFTCSFPQQTISNSVQGWIHPISSNGWQTVFVHKPAAGETNFDIRAVEYVDAAGANVSLATNFATNIRTLAANAAYALPLFSAGSQNPADSTTYYFGADPNANLNTTWNLSSAEVPKSGTLKRVFIKVRVAGTLGSTEAVSHYVRINDTTDVTVNTTATYDTTATNIVGILSQAVSAGDYVNLKVVTPAWVTNPTTVRFYAILYIE